MTRVAFWFALLCALFVAYPAAAAESTQKCANGDTVSGPNCVHEMNVEAQDHDAFEGWVTASWVYRVVNGRPRTVWRGLGKVLESTPEKLYIYVWFVPKRGSVKNPTSYGYDIFWDGKTYSIR